MLASVLSAGTRGVRLGFVFLALVLTVSAQTHPPGDDHSSHSGGPPRPDEADFSVFVIPVGFFGPNSDPFTGIVPLNTSIVGPGNADTSVRRMGALNLPPPFPAMDTVPIEIIALNLVSVNPITVTYNGGGSPELWDLKVVFPPVPGGNLTATKASPAGGTFTATIFVQPLFVFERVSDGAIRNQPVNGTLMIQGPWLEVPVPNGVSTGPNFYPRDCTLDFFESGSGASVLRGGITPAVALPKVPALSTIGALVLATLLAVAGIAVLRRRAQSV